MPNPATSGEAPSGTPANIPTAATPHDNSWRRAHIAFALVMAGALCLFLSIAPPSLAFAPLVPTVPLLAIAAAVAACYLRAGRPGHPAAPPARRISAWLLVLSAVLLVAGILTMMSALGVVHERAKTAGSRANLRGIGIVIREYAADHGEWPPALATLVEHDYVSSRQTLTRYEPDLNAATHDSGYSSFAYVPGHGAFQPEPEVILAYERVASGARPVGRSLWTVPVHAVLFGDGKSVSLDSDELRAAMRASQVRRAELGWPQFP
jgi:competence protein ComGC